MPNYPASLDVLTNPLPTTELDDPGFELDVVIGRIHDILEALEVKLGTGASTPGVQQILNGIGSGSASWTGSPTISGAVTVGSLTSAAGVTANSVNVNTTGAAAGELKTLAAIRGGGAIFPSGQATISWRVITSAQVIGNTSAVDIGASICVVTILNHSTGDSTVVGLKGTAATVIAHSPTTTGFTINSDTGVAIRVFWSTDRYFVRNSVGSSQTLSIWAMGA